MAYTNPWSTSIPPGSADANTLDTIIQQVRLDIAERNNTIIGASGSMSSDPVVDGINALDLTSLTALANSKTTLSGLTIGSLVKATSASQVGNSLLSEPTLIRVTGAPVVTVLSAPATGATIGTISLNAGTYLVSISGQLSASGTSGNLNIQVGLVTELVASYSPTNNFVMTGFIVVSFSPTTITFICSNGLEVNNGASFTVTTKLLA